MGWWKRFNDWIDRSIDKAAKSPLDDWEPGPLIWIPSSQPMPAECSDVKSPVESIAPVVDHGQTSEPESGESEEPGNVTTETTLEHVDDLPGATYRVFPSAGNHRNSYDSEGGVRRAVSVRLRWYGPGNYGPRGFDKEEPIRVYRAETVWRDVTSEFVR